MLTVSPPKKINKKYFVISKHINLLMLMSNRDRKKSSTDTEILAVERVLLFEQVYAHIIYSGRGK